MKTEHECLQQIVKIECHQGCQDDENTSGVKEGNSSRQAFHLIIVALGPGNISVISFVEPPDCFGHMQ